MRFEVDERLEAGIVLTGSEVKSLRDKRADMEGAFATIANGEAFLHHTYIAPYEQAGSFGHEPRRTRKLLLHAREIEQIKRAVEREGMTVVATRLYFKGGRVKVELALAKGKKKADKREAVKEREATREAPPVRPRLSNGRSSQPGRHGAALATLTSSPLRGEEVAEGRR